MEERYSLLHAGGRVTEDRPFREHRTHEDFPLHSQKHPSEKVPHVNTDSCTQMFTGIFQNSETKSATI